MGEAKNSFICLIKMISFNKRFCAVCARLIRKSLHSDVALNAKVSPVTPVAVKRPTVDQIFQGLVDGDRAALARSITLVESTNDGRRAEAKRLLTQVLQHNSSAKLKTFRIGLTGPPGAGKSTFIEALGKMLIARNHKLAVLAVDPSSSSTGGSLLGDKTRMPELSASSRAYVRPSPNSCTLGGVTRATNEAINLVECCGFDVVLVETVGVGQSEVAVADMVDMFVLIIPPAGGDELQGIKKGVIEFADVVVVNKSDGDLVPAARKISAEYISALKFVRPRGHAWKPVVKRISSKTQEGLEDLWETMRDFQSKTTESGEFAARRTRQLKVWMWSRVNERLLDLFYAQVGETRAQQMEGEVMGNRLTPGDAADELIRMYREEGGIAGSD